ncbi:glycoside hydrolase family 99-like domain-containing protein [Megalodesulfovibrio paquesii]
MSAWRHFHKLGHGVREFGLPAVARSLAGYARGTRLRPQPAVQVPPEPQGPALATPPAVKLLAFHLPQFHPIPENDVWWGEGFTEWTNVRRARPLFPGHVQPDLPDPACPLGEYDLRDPDALRRQIALARHHGVHGFCFHYYWFGGKRLLERPLELLLADPSLDLPYCLNWANESWSRRWDGSSEVLLRQEHSPEDDLAVIQDLLRHFRDPRYIRVDGRPLFLVYRPALFPDMRATLGRWRAACTAAGEAAPFFVMVQSFRMHDPRPDGFDAAVQFPPHLGYTPFGFGRVRAAGLAPEFAGRMFSFTELARVTLAGLAAPYPTFPCVCPGWDNTPRRGAAATVFLNATPERYAAWLAQACRHARTAFPESRRLVFVNAWNEWAEGAHLEPNLAHGHAFLNATTRVLAS